MRVAILAARAGLVRRGVESLAFELASRLPFEASVLSLVASDWTVRVPGVTRDHKIHRFYTWLSKRLHLAFADQLIPRVHLLNHFALEEWSYGWNLRGVLDVLRPDVVLNLSGPIIGRFCSAYRRRVGTPFVVAGEAGVGLTEKKNVYTRPDKYIAISPDALRFVRRIDPDLDVELVPNGVNVELFRPSGPRLSEDTLRSMSGNPKLVLQAPIVVSTSALEKGKRLDLAIRALELLGYGTLLLAGDGAERDALVSLGQRLLGTRFGWLGPLPYSELPALYRTADVFCMPSANEPFGNVIVEAMASGRPVVATDDETRRWLLGSRGGIVVDVTAIDRHAEAIQRGYSTDWGEGPRNEALRFSWDMVAERYAQVLKQAADKRSR